MTKELDKVWALLQKMIKDVETGEYVAQAELKARKVDDVRSRSRSSRRPDTGSVAEVEAKA